MIEHEKREASGTAKTALGLSIGALGAELLTGGLNGLIGGVGAAAPACAGDADSVFVWWFQAAESGADGSWYSLGPFLVYAI